MFWSDLFEMMPYEFVLQIQFKYIRAFTWTLIQSISNMLTGWHVNLEENKPVGTYIN